VPNAGQVIKASDSLTGAALDVVTLTANSAANTSATLADLTGATTTVPVINGRSYEISFRCRGVQSTVANDVIQIALLAAGTQVADGFFIATGTSARAAPIMYGVFDCVSSGSVTFKVQYARNSGTGNCVIAAAGTPMYLLVRDIGPTT
jgi:hypothetical protein